MPAKMEAVDAMLELADLQPGETVVDIGSGDGRVVIAAATRYPEIRQAVGIELDPTLVALSLRRVAELNEVEPKLRLASRAHFILEDFTNVELGEVDVVVLFFLPHEDLARVLGEKLRAGTRVVTYVFQIAQWTPERSTETVPFMTSHGSSPVFLYRVPPDPLNGVAA